MMRRTFAVIAGLVLLVGLASLPSVAGAQTPPGNPPFSPPGPPPPEVLPEPPVVPEPPRPNPPPQRPTEEEPDVVVAPDEAEKPTEQAQPEVRGDVVSRPLPRTGNDIGGTAVFGGALTILGVALALGARKRRNSFDGA